MKELYVKFRIRDWMRQWGYEPILKEMDYGRDIDWPIKGLGISVDDLFWLEETIKYSFHEMPISPFQVSERSMPPQYIIMEYKGLQQNIGGIYLSIGQALTYQVKAKVPTYLVLDGINYQHLLDVFAILPIGIITYISGESFGDSIKVIQHSDVRGFRFHSTGHFCNPLNKPIEYSY